MDIDSLALFNLLDTQSLSTHGSSHGLRAEFENLALATDGSANLRLGDSLQPVGAGTLSQIQVLLILVADSGAGDIPFLRIQEIDPNDISNPIGESSVELLASEATAILSGAHVRFDLLIDDSGNTTSAEIKIDSVPASAGAVLALIGYQQQRLEFAFFGLTLFVNLSLTPPTPVDLTLVQTSSNVQPSLSCRFSRSISVARWERRKVFMRWRAGSADGTASKIWEAWCLSTSTMHGLA